MENQDLNEFCALISDIAHGLFDGDADRCDVQFVRGDRKVTFVIRPKDKEACSRITGKHGRIIHRIDAVVEVYGELRGMDFDVVVDQPPSPGV